MKRLTLDRDNAVFASGVILSIIVNCIFYTHHATSHMQRMIYAISIYLPYIIALGLAALLIFIKSVLRKDVPVEKWDRGYAKAIVIGGNGVVKRLMAKIFLCLIDPASFLAGWCLGNMILLAMKYNPLSVIIAGVVVICFDRIFKVVIKKNTPN